MSLVASHVGVLAQLNPLEHVAPVPLFTFPIGDYQITMSNHAFMVVVSAILLAVIIPLATRSPKLIPSGLQNLIESVCVFLRDQMARGVLGHQTDKYIGLLWTTFFFVLILNLIGMVPSDKVVNMVLGKPSHFGGAATANIYVTGALAAVATIMTVIFGIREHGVIGYLASIAPPVPTWLLPLMYPLEVLSMSIRPFTLAIRLFANIIAGHMVVGTILGLIFLFRNLGVAGISVVGAAALSLLDLLVAFIQAYVFTFLFTLYIRSSVSSEH
jgi:F-type H+-transporting ATPase subunit a